MLFHSCNAVAKLERPTIAIISYILRMMDSYSIDLAPSSKAVAATRLVSYENSNLRPCLGARAPGLGAHESSDTVCQTRLPKTVTLRRRSTQRMRGHWVLRSYVYESA